MKNAKILTCLLSMVVLMMFFVSCSKTVDENMFEFTTVNPQTTIKVGEKVTFIAKLTNLTDKQYTLEHGLPLITLYICNADDETPDGVGSVLIKTDIKPNGSIEQVYNSEPLEAGEYILRAYCSFGIGDQKLRYECDNIPITVVEK